MTLDSSLSKIGDNISKIIRGEYKPYYKFFSNEKQDDLHRTIINNLPSRNEKSEKSSIIQEDIIVSNKTQDRFKTILKDCHKLRENLKSDAVKKDTKELGLKTDKTIVELKDMLHKESLQNIDYRKFSEFTKDSLNFVSHPIDLYAHNFDANINRFNNSDLSQNRMKPS